MNNTQIYVVTHKEFDDSHLGKGYNVITVGGKSLGNASWKSDNTGENISDMNPYYCELTAQYWMWKNLPREVENVGLVHYRRYFMNYHSNSSNCWDDILTVSDAENILNKYDIIVPIKSFKNPKSSILYRNLPDSEQDVNWLIIQDIINKHFPKEAKAFSKVIYGKTQIWCNMLIAKRHIFDQYTEWIFNVLKYYDDAIAASGEERIPRVDGYLSELLILVWITAHISDDKVYYCPMENIEDVSNLPYDKGGIIRIRRGLRAKYKKGYVMYRNIRTRLHIILHKI